MTVIGSVGLGTAASTASQPRLQAHSGPEAESVSFKGLVCCCCQAQIRSHSGLARAAFQIDTFKAGTVLLLSSDGLHPQPA